MRRVVLGLALCVACRFGAPLGAVVVDEVGAALAGVAHPKATFVDAELSDFVSGGVSPGRRERWLDLSIAYDHAKDGPGTMKVRIYVESVEPCRVAVDVIEDSGRKPKMLDNAVVGRIVGRKLCAAFRP